MCGLSAACHAGRHAAAGGRGRGAALRAPCDVASRRTGSLSRWPDDGVSGLELARHGDFDAVLLDVMLPRLSGYDVVRTLRPEENWVPVLMLSAKDGEHDQADGLDCGADDYLTKPFSYVVLLARLRALLRRAPSRGRPYSPPGTSAWTRPPGGSASPDEPVALTPREYGLLEYLLRRPGRVVTKVEILDHVWDAAADVEPERRRGLRRLPAPQARATPRRDGARRRVPPRTMTPRGNGSACARACCWSVCSASPSPSPSAASRSTRVLTLVSFRTLDASGARHRRRRRRRWSTRGGCPIPFRSPAARSSRSSTPGTESSARR